MENNINVSALAQNIADQCKRFEESQEYKDMITAAVKKLYTGAIDDVFRWGEFPDRVKEAIKNAMPSDIGNFVDLAKYNTLITNTLKTEWGESGIEDNAVQKIKSVAIDAINNLKIPEFVLMSELFEAFIESNEDEAAENGWEKPNILLKDSESVDGYWSIGFEAEPETTSSYMSAKTHTFSFENCLNLSPVFIDRKNKEFKLHEGNECYELYAGKIRGDILGKEVIKPYSEYEKLICALYFGGAYLVLDDFDPEDIYYPNEY
ncbi:hypothetical protein RFH42_03275 [Acinetobacter rudis]|uniref:hypothetical protein n=1 Tax=Acinetobacter rudis TaxID=632955 RepID=UPI00280E6D2D|nr:hypothetical protein [Acinetobacter rudis]MDQ8951975.1 hypothetical protein [Acinetobacter rudis]